MVNYGFIFMLSLYKSSPGHMCQLLVVDTCAQATYENLNQPLDRSHICFDSMASDTRLHALTKSLQHCARINVMMM